MSIVKKGLTSHYFYEHLCLIEGALPASARMPACRLHSVATQVNAKSGGSAGFLYVCNLVCRGQRCTFCCLLCSHLFCIVRDWTYISGTSFILLVPFWGLKEFQCSSRKDCWCSVWLNLQFSRRSPWNQGRWAVYMLLSIHNNIIILCSIYLRLITLHPQIIILIVKDTHGYISQPFRMR